ncbi:exodeoxyribonuclease VII large subunit [Gordonia sp. (in: high G+C Gram-positive bacteria)]|uniref:exodeoxyribonuclease VII large subunit n=1 Tax=Gordonia sp. (in: high G+C Gram-positive bacteria) TaxID=84139 RepID=UPI0016BA0966|nr:exodeoxyribonuclease VII large subunit [Gordonia sp. (in: high G+C Gram-positive bacteria)]NLG46122.1 exodeoxyribonuclease VII large subunit [Gordonia sp. (in: high G+C Gram-positive bacteria)]
MSQAAPDQANSAENPWPVRTISFKIADWIHRLGQIWVEGQLTQINHRRGTRTAFLTLRDPAADMSLSVTCDPILLERSPVPLTEGSRVVVYGRPSFYTGRGTLSLRITDIRPVGIGELLARIERVKALLAAEGLFDPRRKRPLPFLPHTVGLISGRASAAQRDVIAVASARWEAVRFDVRDTPVQGPTAVPAIVEQLRLLDDDPRVQVIVIARGGGSVEDLLPFSDETLLRAVVDCRTPVVSAIGHEPDNPLLDLVADVRAATPTDAAKRVVPDVTAELAAIADIRRRTANALRNWVHREERVIDGLRSRPVLAHPLRMIDDRQDRVDAAVRDIRRSVRHQLTVEEHLTHRLAAQLATLGPAQTLARGYAVVQRTDIDHPHAVRSTEELPAGATVRIRVADGSVAAEITAETPAMHEPAAIDTAAEDPAATDTAAEENPR